MNRSAGLFRGYEFLSTSKDSARDVYRIEAVDASLARLFQSVF